MTAHEPEHGDADEFDLITDDIDGEIPFVDGSLVGNTSSAKGPDGRPKEQIEAADGELYYLIQGDEGPYYKVTP